MNELIDSLWLAVLTDEFHKQTCGYWYTVTNRAASHRAFRTEKGLRRWMTERGLQLTQELTLPGTFSTQPLLGKYVNVSHWDEEQFAAIQPIETTYKLCNASWTLAKITEEDGVRHIHYMNPNRKRQVFDYWEINQLMD